MDHLTHGKNSSCRKFLLTQKEEDLIEFLDYFATGKKLSKTLDLKWKKLKLDAICNGDNSDNQFKLVLRVFLIAAHCKDESNWKWGLSQVESLEEQKRVLKADNYHAMKFIMDTNDERLVRRLLNETKIYLNREEYIDMLKNTFEHSIYYHGKLYDGEAWNSTISLEVLLRELGSSTCVKVINSLNELSKTKLKTIVPHCEQLHHITSLEKPDNYLLNNNDQENNLVRFLNFFSKEKLQTPPKGKISTTTVFEAKWKEFNFDNLREKDNYKVILRLFLIAVGCSELNKWKYSWGKVKLLGKQKDVLCEDKYHAVKCVVDIHDTDLLHRILKEVKIYLDKEEQVALLTSVFKHILDTHGSLFNGEVWDSTESLNILKKVLNPQWESIFKYSVGKKSKINNSLTNLWPIHLSTIESLEKLFELHASDKEPVGEQKYFEKTSRSPELLDNAHVNNCSELNSNDFNETFGSLESPAKKLKYSVDENSAENFSAKRLDSNEYPINIVELCNTLQQKIEALDARIRKLEKCNKHEN